MKIKAIRLTKHRDFSSEQETELKNMIIIIALFTAGMIIGSGIMRKGSSEALLADFSSIFDVFASNRNELKAYKIFINSLFTNLLFVFSLFFSGFSCIGIPIIYILPVIKGLGLGALSGYLLTMYSMNGMGYYLLTIIPSGIVSVSVVLLAGCTSAIMSKELLGIVLEKRQPNSTTAITYIKKYAIFFAGMVLASTVETVFVKAFSYLFVF